MTVLLDHNLPRNLRRHLPGHDVRTSKSMGWDQLRNGVLLRMAAGDGFEAFLSIDKKIEYEHNLATLPLPVVLLDAYSNALPDLLPMIPTLSELLATPPDRALYVVTRDGHVLRIDRAR